MQSARPAISSFFTDDSGLAVTEYGLLLALVMIVAVVAVKLVAPKVTALVQSGTNAVPSGTP
jgi:Flp pilus assembly pilin Flp